MGFANNVIPGWLLDDMFSPTNVKANNEKKENKPVNGTAWKKDSTTHSARIGAIGRHWTITVNHGKGAEIVPTLATGQRLVITPGEIKELHRQLCELDQL